MSDATAPALPRAAITGLVLAGGRGSRMGGVDKGLQDWRGTPLALHALSRLAPQVGTIAVNANRHLDSYRSFGVPVWPDDALASGTTSPDDAEAFLGPLAGLLTGLRRAGTSHLATVPCDCPGFPADLVGRLGAAIGAPSSRGAEIAVAAVRDGDALRVQPVFCLLPTALAPALAAFLAAGERKFGRWLTSRRTVVVEFDSAAAFFNANTAEDLQVLDSHPPG